MSELPRRKPNKLTLEFMMSRVSPEPNSGCWLWLGTVNTNGYGQIKSFSKMYSAHRVMYELIIGPIPNGLEIDHLCRTPLCVNPKHLEPVTRSRNLLRSPLVGRYNSEKTECPNGHSYNEKNTYRRWRGTRECRECNRLRGEEIRKKKKMAKESLYYVKCICGEKIITPETKGICPNCKREFIIDWGKP